MASIYEEIRKYIKGIERECIKITPSYTTSIRLDGMLRAVDLLEDLEETNHLYPKEMRATSVSMKKIVKESKNFYKEKREDLYAERKSKKRKDLEKYAAGSLEVYIGKMKKLLNSYEKAFHWQLDTPAWLHRYFSQNYMLRETEINRAKKISEAQKSSALTR